MKNVVSVRRGAENLLDAEAFLFAAGMFIHFFVWHGRDRLLFPSIGTEWQS